MNPIYVDSKGAVSYSIIFKENEVQISMFQCAFFNSIIDKYQHMHFFAFNTVLV